MASSARTSLQLMEYSDPELLHLVNDLADNDGWVAPGAVADEIGISHPFPTRCVISRFAWLVRYGVMERSPEDARYRLTTDGKAAIDAKLRVTQQKALNGMNDEALMQVTQFVTERWRKTNKANSNLIRRQWQYGTGRRR